MKRFFCIFMALYLFCNLIIGCTSQPDRLLTEQYLFHIGELDGVESLLMFNVTNGETTFVCFDPLCRHTQSSECPFALIDYFAIEDDLLYYRRIHYNDTGFPEWYLCTYNLVTMKIKHIATVETTGKSGFAFFYQGMYYEECISVENIPYYLSVDMTSGDIREYAELPVLPDEKVKPSDHYRVFDGQLLDSSGQILLDKVDYYIPCGDIMICYVKDETSEYIGFCETTGREIYNLYDGSIYILFSDSGRIAEVQTNEYLMTDASLVGNYIVVSYGGFIDNLGKSLWSTAGRLVIDLDSYEIVKYPKIVE